MNTKKCSAIFDACSIANNINDNEKSLNGYYKAPSYLKDATIATISALFEWFRDYIIESSDLSFIMIEGSIAETVLLQCATKSNISLIKNVFGSNSSSSVTKEMISVGGILFYLLISYKILL